MKPDIKKLWMDNLNSGAYKQTNSVLRSFEGYCCLGVLCDLHSKATGTDWESEDPNGDEDGFSYCGSSVYLPEEVRIWSGLQSPDPYADAYNTLSKVNDAGSDFRQIARIIETNL